MFAGEGSAIVGRAFGGGSRYWVGIIATAEIQVQHAGFVGSAPGEKQSSSAVRLCFVLDPAGDPKGLVNHVRGGGDFQY
jgi:hypothetical protein